MHMIALYWWEALILPRGFLASQTAAHPVMGFILIVLGTCGSAYGAAYGHWWLHEKIVKMLWLKNSAVGLGGSAIDVKPKYT